MNKSLIVGCCIIVSIVSLVMAASMLLIGMMCGLNPRRIERPIGALLGIGLTAGVSALIASLV